MQVVIDMTRPAEKQMILEFVRKLDGMHRVEIVKYRPRRTDSQNRYYWPCVVQPFADFLRAQGQTITDEQAHDLMKAKFLTISVINPGSGEVIGERVRSTTELKVEEFGEYLEKVMAWLADMFGIECPIPNTIKA
jgi:hypothetical protein